MSNQQTITKTICDGGLANESLFAIIFKFYKELEDGPSNSHINCVVTHLADWNRRSSTTSPHLFKDANEEDIKFIDKELVRNFYAMFIRKVAPEFPDEILRHYIYDHTKNDDNRLVLVEPIEMVYSRYRGILTKCFYILLIGYTSYLVLCRFI